MSKKDDAPMPAPVRTYQMIEQVLNILGIADHLHESAFVTHWQAGNKASARDYFTGLVKIEHKSMSVKAKQALTTLIAAPATWINADKERSTEDPTIAAAQNAARKALEDYPWENQVAWEKRHLVNLVKDSGADETSTKKGGSYPVKIETISSDGLLTGLENWQKAIGSLDPGCAVDWATLATNAVRESGPLERALQFLADHQLPTNHLARGLNVWTAEWLAGVCVAAGLSADGRLEAVSNFKEIHDLAKKDGAHTIVVADCQKYDPALELERSLRFARCSTLYSLIATLRALYRAEKRPSELFHWNAELPLDAPCWMPRRRIDEALAKWLRSTEQKPLLITGTSWFGKSTLMAQSERLSANPIFREESLGFLSRSYDPEFNPKLEYGGSLNPRPPAIVMLDELSSAGVRLQAILEVLVPNGFTSEGLKLVCTYIRVDDVISRHGISQRHLGSAIKLELKETDLTPESLEVLVALLPAPCRMAIRKSVPMVISKVSIAGLAGIQCMASRLANMVNQPESQLVAFINTESSYRTEVFV